MSIRARARKRDMPRSETATWVDGSYGKRELGGTASRGHSSVFGKTSSVQ